METAKAPIFFQAEDGIRDYKVTGVQTCALPISPISRNWSALRCSAPAGVNAGIRSEEHTSELQSPCNLVCRLLLEKKTHKNAASARLAKELKLKVNQPCNGNTFRRVCSFFFF